MTRRAQGEQNQRNKALYGAPLYYREYDALGGVAGKKSDDAELKEEALD